MTGHHFRSVVRMACSSPRRHLIQSRLRSWSIQQTRPRAFYLPVCLGFVGFEGLEGVGRDHCLDYDIEGGVDEVDLGSLVMVWLE